MGEQQKGSQNHKLVLTAANYLQITPTHYSYSDQEWLAITPLTVPLLTPDSTTGASLPYRLCFLLQPAIPPGLIVARHSL